MLTEEYRQTDTHFYFWNTIYSKWFSRKGLIKEENGTIKGTFIEYFSVEQYVSASKALVFRDFDTYLRIRSSDNPILIKQLDIEIKNFSDEIWDKVKMDIVTRANYLKFSQNPDLLETMMEHKHLTLVDASLYDRTSEAGLDFEDEAVLDEKLWDGQNLLGVCIMNARKQILRDQYILENTCLS